MGSFVENMADFAGGDVVCNEEMGQFMGQGTIRARIRSITVNQTELKMHLAWAARQEQDGRWVKAKGFNHNFSFAKNQLFAREIANKCFELGFFGDIYTFYPEGHADNLDPENVQGLDQRDLEQ